MPPEYGEPLTRYEVEALRLYGLTASAKVAAQRLGLAENTVKNYLRDARTKLGAGNTAQALYIARARGIVVIVELEVRPAPRRRRLTGAGQLGLGLVA